MKPLDYITVRDTTGRASSLGIYGRQDNPPMLQVVGNLEHCARFVPDTVADCDKLIAWLQEWKENNKGKK
jgi:hypothetical protein